METFFELYKSVRDDEMARPGGESDLRAIWTLACMKAFELTDWEFFRREARGHCLRIVFGSEKAEVMMDENFQAWRRFKANRARKYDLPPAARSER